MKKMMMTLLAAVVVSTAAVAQNKDDNKSPQDNNRKQEMVKHRTDRLVKDYQLNDQQARQLLELNTKYADKMRPHHPRHHGPHGMKGQRPEPPKGDRQDRRKEMDETMKAYEAELQKIMTPEQFKKYQADMQQRRDEGPRHPRRQQ